MVIRYGYLMRLKFTRRGRAHKIGMAHVEYVMSHYRPTEGFRPSGEAEWDYVGLDDRGLELHIIVVPNVPDKAGNPIMLIIHAMPTALERN